MEGKKQQVVRYLLAIYAIFGTLLAYTVFANTGIEFRVDKDNTPVQLFVNNTSQHEIRNIQVFKQSQTEPFAVIDSLKPGEEKQVDSANLVGKVLLVAKAPYHLDLQTEVELSTQVFLKVALTAPDSLSVDGTDSASLELCNEGTASILASAQFIPNPFVSINPPTQSKAVPSKTCETFQFVVQGVQAGSASIDFNITADQLHKLVSKTVQVQ